MNQLMLESYVHSWDPNNVYKDKCKRFVSNDILQVTGHEPFTFIFVNMVGIPRMYAAF